MELQGVRTAEDQGGKAALLTEPKGCRWWKREDCGGRASSYGNVFW